MRFVQRKITIITSRRPAHNDINDELQYFGNALGLFGLRDKDKSMYRIFIQLIKGAKKQKAYSSDELAIKLNLSRGTVVHHLNKLIQAGIIVSEGNRYMLRVDNLSQLVDEIRKDVDRSITDLKEISDDIDKLLGL